MIRANLRTGNTGGSGDNPDLCGIRMFGCSSLSHLPQPFERLQNPLDLLGAFLVLAAEVGGEGFGIRSGDTLVVIGDELADEGDLVGEAVGPREGGRGID